MSAGLVAGPLGYQAMQARENAATNGLAISSTTQSPSTEPVGLFTPIEGDESATTEPTDETAGDTVDALAAPSTTLAPETVDEDTTTTQASTSSSGSSETTETTEVTDEVAAPSSTGPGPVPTTCCDPTVTQAPTPTIVAPTDAKPPVSAPEPDETVTTVVAPDEQLVTTVPVDTTKPDPDEPDGSTSETSDPDSTEPTVTDGPIDGPTDEPTDTTEPGDTDPTDPTTEPEPTDTTDSTEAPASTGEPQPAKTSPGMPSGLTDDPVGGEGDGEASGADESSITVPHTSTTVATSASS